MRKYISFDWALKRLLRNKANYVVLEGFLTELIGQDIKIERFLESEEGSNFKLVALNGKSCFVTELQKDLPDAHFAVKFVRN